MAFIEALDTEPLRGNLFLKFVYKWSINLTNLVLSYSRRMRAADLDLLFGRLFDKSRTFLEKRYGAA